MMKLSMADHVWKEKGGHQLLQNEVSIIVNNTGR